MFHCHVPDAGPGSVVATCGGALSLLLVISPAGAGAGGLVLVGAATLS